jgi:SAM-dependent methyltransferase
MPSCCAAFGDIAERQFTDRIARRDLKRYRQKGPGRTTRLLRDSIAASGVIDGLLLDVGSGIGALAFELLDRGLTHAVAIDASSSYIAAAREEAERRGRANAIQFVHGDFLSVASQLPSASIVTLDRVVCCYPSFQPLLEEAMRHTDRCLAFSYPRDIWYLRAAVAIENDARRLTHNPFRAFVHPAAGMEQTITAAGFGLLSRSETWAWSTDVYVRRSG